MRRAMILSVWLLACSTCWGVEPKAVLHGPVQVNVGDQINFRLTGTVSDDDPDIQLASGPTDVDVGIAYTKDGKVAYAFAIPAEKGTYEFVVIASGKVEGTAKPQLKFGFWKVQVGTPDLPPVPIVPDQPVVPVIPTTPGAMLGRTYGGLLTSACADSWDDAALALKNGQTVAQAQALFQQQWEARRKAAFTTNVAPAMAAILPEGTDPATKVQRDQVVKLWNDFATGLRGVK